MVMGRLVIAFMVVRRPLTISRNIPLPSQVSLPPGDEFPHRTATKTEVISRLTSPSGSNTFQPNCMRRS